MSAAAATATTLLVRPNRFSKRNPVHPSSFSFLRPANAPTNNNGSSSTSARNPFPRPPHLLLRGGLLAVQAGSRADDSAPFEMSVEGALKLLGVAETASFDEILRAKNSIIAACKDDKDAVAQVQSISLSLSLYSNFDSLWDVNTVLLIERTSCVRNRRPIISLSSRRCWKDNWLLCSDNQSRDYICSGNALMHSRMYHSMCLCTVSGSVFTLIAA